MGKMRKECEIDRKRGGRQRRNVVRRETWNEVWMKERGIRA
jgi:hypothetical protein